MRRNGRASNTTQEVGNQMHRTTKIGGQDRRARGRRPHRVRHRGQRQRTINADGNGFVGKGEVQSAFG